MVNDRAEKIKSILGILKESSRPVSGETLAEALGVSRVAVWKIISGLKNKGYNIESTHSGYMLISSTNKPLPWEINTASGRIEYHEELDSTMNKAALLIDSGCADGTTVIAETQTAGLGSNGKEWKSPDGGLYFTRIRTLPFPTVYSGLYTISIAAAVIRVLHMSFNIEAYMLWPNSIFAQGKKIAGVLTLFRGRNDMISSAAAGVGINLTASGDLPAGAVAVDELAGCSVSAKKITAELLDAIDTQDSIFYKDNMIEEYKKHLGLNDRTVKVSKPNGVESSGSITDLHYSGCLLLKTEDGSIEHIYSGDKITYE